MEITTSTQDDLNEAFHRAIVAFLQWHTENDMRVIYAYAAHHSHDFMWGFAASPERERNCALRPEPKVEWNGRPRPISSICRAAESLSGPLPPLVRRLVEDVVSGILEEVETYAEAASILGEHIEIERQRPSPWLNLPAPSAVV